MRVVIPTQKSLQEYEKTTQFQCLKRLQIDYEDNNRGEYYPYENFTIDIYYNNTIGLSQLYNDCLWNSCKDEDIVVFLHDDVEIHDAFFVDKLKKAHEQYNIVGLAGATTQHYSTDKPSVWHLCVQHNDSVKGFVSHYIYKGFHGAKESHYNSSYFGPTPGPVVVIDGLFISVDVKKVKDKLKEDLLFDGHFKWHHYDINMSICAYNHGVTIGVFPIFCIHHGLGEFINVPEWKQSHEQFLKKYNGFKMNV